MLIHPFSDRKIPLVLDDDAEIEFGTGAVKVTPAHDKTDFAIGKRHNLPSIDILNDDNTMNQEAGEFAGMARFDVRVLIVQRLKDMGLYRGEDNHKMILPVCSRSGDIIEYRLKPQWWLNCQTMAAETKEATLKGDVQILPKEMEKTYYNWLDNIMDWCLSRQLWWGHRIPAYRILNVKSDDENVCFREPLVSFEVTWHL